MKTLLLAIIVASGICSAAGNREGDSITLAAIKNINPGSVIDTINEVLWKNFEQVTNAWREGNSIENWEGVTVENDRVVELNLHECNITALPEELGNLSALTSLKISKNLMYDIPEVVWNLAALKYLRLGQDEIDSISSQISKLTNLETLLAYGFSAIPAEIGELSNLKDITFREGGLTGFPFSFEKLVNLEVLSAAFNNISEMPNSIENLPLLKTVLLSNNNFMEIPEVLFTLSKLKTLDLSYNNIQSINSAISNLTNLTSLQLHFNLIDSVPKSMGSMLMLDRIDLNDNKIKIWPEELCTLYISSLYLHNNEIASLPSKIGELFNLDILYLQNNKIKNLPESLGSLARLQNLNLSNNSIDTIPFDISYWWVRADMEELNLSHNNITTLTGLYIDRYDPIPKTDIGYNKIMEGNLTEDMIIWLDASDSDWRETQNLAQVINNFSVNLQKCQRFYLLGNRVIFKRPETFKIQIFSIKGQEVKELSGKSLIVDLNNLNLSCGIYQMKLTIGNEVLNSKLILK